MLSTDGWPGWWPAQTSNTSGSWLVIRSVYGDEPSLCQVVSRPNASLSTEEAWAASPASADLLSNPAATCARTDPCDALCELDALQPRVHIGSGGLNLLAAHSQAVPDRRSGAEACVIGDGVSHATDGVGDERVN